MAENEGSDSRFLSGFLLGFLAGVLICLGIGGGFVLFAGRQQMARTRAMELEARDQAMMATLEAQRMRDVLVQQRKALVEAEAKAKVKAKAPLDAPLKPPEEENDE